MEFEEVNADPFSTEERVALREMVRSFAEKEIVPNIDEWERIGLLPRELHERAAEIGLLGIEFDESIGGSGGDSIDFFTMAEELTYAGRSSGLIMSLFAHRIALAPIVSQGGPLLVDQFVRPTLAGTAIAAFAVTEPGGGSDVAALRTTARREGDFYVVNGAKIFISSAVRADFIVAAVRTGGSGYGGISLLVIPSDTPGFEVVRKLDKMGWDCSDTADLAFTDVRVPVANLIGAENEGFRMLTELFLSERLGQAAIAYSTAQRCLDLAEEWCRQRSTFGKPLMSRQLVRHKITEMAHAVDVARTYTRQIIRRVAAGEILVPQVCMAKRQSTDACSFVADAALQLHGGTGYMRDTEINRHYRDARVMSIAGGTNEMMSETVAKWMGYV
ncbi:MAG: acyl-CoA dehydrogenase [Nocardia sp.]|uniref:acyl-CoA dehydrogenase family protein n=1 Tax=Nocardia sp. TaxID=1821 RepID=UPI0026115281|nr:acyl-CoA dehydrogenase family protein [Nocardia sp.]MCU1648039.1 acyl-CoA dehydrogenase [Nocardia sp.]